MRSYIQSRNIPIETLAIFTPRWLNMPGRGQPATGPAQRATVRVQYAFACTVHCWTHARRDKFGCLNESTGPAGKLCPPNKPGSCLVADSLASHPHSVPGSGYVSVPTVGAVATAALFLCRLKAGSLLEQSR